MVLQCPIYYIPVPSRCSERLERQIYESGSGDPNTRNASLEAVAWECSNHGLHGAVPWNQADLHIQFQAMVVDHRPPSARAESLPQSLLPGL